MTRDELKVRAEELGLSYNSNIKTDALAELITNAENGLTPEIVAAAKEAEEVAKKLVAEKPVEVVVENKAKTVGQVKAEARKNALKLVRCVVASMDKDKADLSGEIISCGNSMTGMIKKFIPFGKEWHVPTVILETLKDKKMLMTRDRRTDKGTVKEHYEVSQYNVQILPDLTQEELNRLLKEDGKK